MLRMLTIVAAIAGAVLFSSVALAQLPEPTLPVAGPDEIIFVGEVPAPPGTEITLEYLHTEGTPEYPTTDGFLLCASTRADENSRFILAIDVKCTRGGLGPLICWGGSRDNCQSLLPSPRSNPDLSPRGSDTVDTGLLAPDVRDTSFAIPHRDGGTNVALPQAGTGEASNARYGLPMLIWTGAGLLGIGLITVGIRGALMKRRQSGLN